MVDFSFHRCRGHCKSSLSSSCTETSCRSSSNRLLGGLLGPMGCNPPAAAIRPTLEAQIPAGDPRQFPGSVAHAKFFHVKPIMRFWKPCAWGFLARVSPISPWKLARPLDIGRRSPPSSRSGRLREDARSSGERRRRRLDLLPVFLQPSPPSHQVIPLSPSPCISLLPC